MSAKEPTPPPTSGYSNPVLFDYFVVEHGNIEVVMNEVTRRLRSGWICQGGISTGFNRYQQAMTMQYTISKLPLPPPPKN